MCDESSRELFKREFSTLFAPDCFNDKKILSVLNYNIPFYEASF